MMKQRMTLLATNNDDNETENDNDEIACEGMGLGQDSWPEL